MSDSMAAQVAAATQDESGELTDGTLEAVAGGGPLVTATMNCHCSCDLTDGPCTCGGGTF